jgi:hypothetical protein
MALASEILDMAKSYTPAELNKFDKATYDKARQALAELIAIEAKEMADEDHNEEVSIAHLLAAVHHLFAWFEGEEAEGEVVEEETYVEAKAAAPKDIKPKKDEKRADFMKRCKEAGMADDDAVKCWDKYTAADTDKPVEAEKSADISKCLECGCNQPGTDHGLTTTNDFANVAKPSHVTTAEMYTPDQTPKSAEADAVEDKADEAAPADTEVPAEEDVKEDSTDEKQ